MKERPILFSTEMVKAILDGRKTQTRRIVKPQPHIHTVASGITHLSWQQRPSSTIFLSSFPTYNSVIEEFIKYCPYGQVGDRLWGRETFCYKVDPITAVVSENEFWYKATNPEVIKIDDDGSHAFRKDGCSASPWLPSIHMPRELSRIILEITNIRVERLQEITGNDVISEGMRLPIPVGCTQDEMLIAAFHALWDSINAKRGYSWKSNPWVWVIEFKRLGANNVS